MWSLGGLSVSELLKRTARESWEDEIFGQSGRLAFYHFIALFPGLLLLLMLLARMSHTGAGMRLLLADACRRLLPEPAAALVTGAIADLDGNAHRAGMLFGIAAASAVWAGFNASWAMIVGLNTAYETAEDRTWWQIARAASGLACAVLALVFAALLAGEWAGPAVPGPLPAILQWASIAAILLLSFGLFYRFGPNLRQRSWQWTTPGAVFGTLLWLGSTLLVRVYFDRFSSYPSVYGRVAAPAMLLMWLYVTAAAILIGAELNSEIEKADERRGALQPARRQVRRDRGV